MGGGGWLVGCVGVVERWMSSGCIEGGVWGVRRAGFWMGSSAPR